MVVHLNRYYENMLNSEVLERLYEQFPEETSAYVGWYNTLTEEEQQFVITSEPEDFVHSLHWLRSVPSIYLHEAILETGVPQPERLAGWLENSFGYATQETSTSQSWIN